MRLGLAAGHYGKGSIELHGWPLKATNGAFGYRRLFTSDKMLSRARKWWSTLENASHYLRMADFKKLKVWQHSHALALETYEAAVGARGAHHMSLRSQLIRASASIPANIVEGRARKTEKDFVRFIDYALGSASELEYHLIFARDVKAVKSERINALLSQLVKVRKMLNGLRARLLGEKPPGPKSKESEDDNTKL